MADVKIPVDGYDCWRWPEFQAFARRLGIDLTARTKTLTVRVAFDEMVVVTQEFLASDAGAQADIPEIIDTTTLNNERWRTAAPNSRLKEAD